MNAAESKTQMQSGVCESCGGMLNVGPNGLCADCDANVEAERWRPLIERLQQLEAMAARPRGRAGQGGNDPRRANRAGP